MIDDNFNPHHFARLDVGMVVARLRAQDGAFNAGDLVYTIYEGGASGAPYAATGLTIVGKDGASEGSVMLQIRGVFETPQTLRNVSSFRFVMLRGSVAYELIVDSETTTGLTQQIVTNGIVGGMNAADDESLFVLAINPYPEYHYTFLVKTPTPTPTETVTATAPTPTPTTVPAAQVKLRIEEPNAIISINANAEVHTYLFKFTNDFSGFDYWQLYNGNYLFFNSTNWDNTVNKKNKTIGGYAKSDFDENVQYLPPTNGTFVDVMILPVELPFAFQTVPTLQYEGVKDDGNKIMKNFAVTIVP